MKTYLVIDVSDKYELPCGAFNTLAECAAFLGTSPIYAWYLYKWGVAYHNRYQIIKPL